MTAQSQQKRWHTSAESDVQCFHNAEWARDLPEDAHVHCELLEPVVTAPTPAHMYCIKRVLKTSQAEP